MLLEEIKNGENKEIEYKRELPEHSEKYMKSVVAFANSYGGKVIFGVEDKTREIVGIDEEKAFQLMDSIANAISDSCEPAIIPDITLQTVENKKLIVVEIAASTQRPYYIKSLGKEKGAYIRVAGTTRHADETRLKELMFEGASKSFDQAICLGFDITDKDINDLCDSMYNTAVNNCYFDEVKHEIKKPTKNNLLSWGIIVEKDGKNYPTNSFALLTGNEILSTKIQCGVFKGDNRAIFVDRREFTGSIQNQIEEAYRYVLSKINLGAEIEGLYRQDMYEMPVGSIREIIANAVTHRSYLESGNVQVALYDNRLEVTSPGMLLNGVTIEKIREGYSKVRNRAIANAFSYMRIIEEWGSGIPRMFDEFSKYDLTEPELIDMDGDFRVNFYRSSVTSKVTEKVTEKVTDRELSVLNLIKNNPKITTTSMAAELGKSRKTISEIIKSLKDRGIIKREGSDRKGSWSIK
ncbi:MAG: putative DNA binding domain-containing protein [Clostridia bacterium]|nr:putative DNA binding domain-containing protein [Clostridia bacterium]